MDIRETIEDGEKQIEIVDCELDAKNYLKLALAIYFSVCITIFLIGTTIHLLVSSGSAEPTNIVKYLYSVFVEQRGALLLYLIISLPVYKFIVAKLSKPSIKIKSK